MYEFLNIIFSLFVGAMVIIGPILFIKYRNGKKHPAKDSKWYLRVALSKEDAVSQLFLLLSVFFLSMTLLAFNKDFGQPLSWQALWFIASVVGLVMAYYLKAVYLLVFGLLSITSWWLARAAEWMLGGQAGNLLRPDGNVIRATALYCGLAFILLLFYSLGHLHEKEMRWKRFSLVYLIFGVVGITGALFFLSTRIGLAILERTSKGLLFFSSWQLTLSLAVFVIAGVGAAWYASAKKLMSRFELAAVVLLMILFSVILLLPEQSMFINNSNNGFITFDNGELSSNGMLWAILFNSVVFLEILGIVFSGYMRREAWLINLGALFLFIFIIMKYFDWFFSFLDKSVFFVGAGILLFVAGWLMERGKRLILSSVKEHT